MNIPFAALRRYTLCKCVLRALPLLGFAMGAHAAEFRYFRFKTTRTSGGGSAVQIAEFQLYKGAARMFYPDAISSKSTDANSDRGATGKDLPFQAIDDTPETDWTNTGGLDIASLVLDAGAGNTMDADGYLFITGHNSSRTPVSWRLEGSSDGTMWTTLDIRSNQTVPATVESPSALLSIPAQAPPEFTSFSYGPAVILNGGSTSLSYTTARATSVALSPGGTLATSASGLAISPPAANSDTSYTLTAGPGGEQKPVTIRTVTGETHTYQYVRFTPLKAGNFNNLLKICDLDFCTYDAAGNQISQINPVSVRYDGQTTVPTGTLSPNNLKDHNPATYWLSSGAFRPLVFDFGSAQSFNRYSFTLAGAAAGDWYPLRWKIEGGSSLTGPWKAIENFNSFDYPVPRSSTGTITGIPFPGASMALELSSFQASRNPALTGAPTTLTWTVAGEQTVTLRAGDGSLQDVTAAGGTLVVTPPAASTLYTLTATSRANPAVSQTRTLTLSPAAAGTATVIDYPDFTTAGQGITLNGTAKLINDYPALPAAGDKLRLSLITEGSTDAGSASFTRKVPVGLGFDTTFHMILAAKERGFGTPGLGFMIQNLSVDTNFGERGALIYGLCVDFSTFANNFPEAKIRIYRGNSSSLQAEQIAEFDLYGLIPLHGEAYDTLTGNYSSPAYKVRITHAAGKMNIYIDDVQVVTDYAVELKDAVDSGGNAWVGFATQNSTQMCSVTSWKLTTGAVTEPAPPLQIIAHAFDLSSGKLTLTWNSASGTAYRITHSSSLDASAAWQPLTSGNINATGSSTTATVDFTKGDKDFFRVEVVSP